MDWRLPLRREPPTAITPMSDMGMAVDEIDEDDTEVGEEEAL